MGEKGPKTETNLPLESLDYPELTEKNVQLYCVS